MNKMVAGVWRNSLMELLNMLKKTVLFHSSKSNLEKKHLQVIADGSSEDAAKTVKPWRLPGSVSLISLEAHPSKQDVGFANLYELL